MWRSLLIGFIGLGVPSSVGLAQDSGPGPVDGFGSQQYNVWVVRFDEVQQGTFTFAANINIGASSGGETTGTISGGTTDGTTASLNPSPVPNTGTGFTATSGNVSTTTTTGGAARTGTATRTTSFYQSSGLSSRLNRSSGSYGFGTVPSANDSTNGTSTNTSGSAIPGLNMQTFTSGEFSAQFGSRTQSGTWYAIDLGNYALFFASTSDMDGGIIVIGRASPGSIFGRINGMSSSSLNAGWFIGTSSGLPAEPNVSSGTIESGGEAD